PPGLASSSQKVPLNTSSFPAPLSVVRVTTVPAGDIRVMSRSAAKVWVRLVVRSRSNRYGPAPETTTVEVTTAGPVGMAVGVDWVKVAVAGPQPVGVAGTTLVRLWRTAAGAPPRRTWPGSSPPIAVESSR